MDTKFTIHNMDKNQLGTLNFITNPTYRTIYSGIDEINFNVPFKIVDPRTHLQTDNPQIPNLIFMYLVKHRGKYFSIDKPDLSSNSNSTYLKVSAKELGYTLKYKTVLYESGIPENPAKNLILTMQDLLLQTNSNWSVGYVDSTLLLDTDGITPINRAIKVDSNMLDAILNSIIIPTAFNCVIDFDSENLLINFYDYALDNLDSGLQMSDTNYIKSVEWDYSLDVLINKLNIFGVDKYPISSITPNGKSYITDYSFLKQIRYMSQSLIDALNNYESILTTPTNDIKIETLIVSSSSVTLHRPLLISEKITVDYNGILLEETTSSTPSQSQYKLNYATGVVTLNSFYNTKSLTFTYDWAYAILIAQKTKLENDKATMENILSNLDISELMVETLTVSSQNVTLTRIPSIADKVTITEDNSDPVVTYTEIFVGSPLINQYKVNYNTGEIAFNISNNSKVLHVEYVGIGLTELQNLVDTATTLDVIYTDLANQLVALKAIQTTQIANLVTQDSLISANQTELDILLSTIAITNYLTSDQITKLNELTVEDTYNDTEITSQSLEPKYLKQLYAEGVKQLKMRNAPRYSLTLDIVDFISATNVSETEKDKLKIGTIVRVKHSTTGIDVTCKIVEINYDYQNYKITIKIANEKDIKDGFTKFADLLTKNNVTSSYVAPSIATPTISPVSSVNNSGLLLGRMNDMVQFQIGTAQTSADGKNTIHYSDTQPSTVGAKIGDTWFDTNDSNAIYKWTGTGYSIVQFGTNAIANLTITNALIADGTILNAKIANLDGGKITAHTITSLEIEANTITVNELASSVGSGLNISSNTSITLKADKTYVDAIQIGGRNLFRNSGNFLNITDWAAYASMTGIAIVSDPIYGNVITAVGSVSTSRLRMGGIIPYLEKVNWNLKFSIIYSQTGAPVITFGGKYFTSVGGEYGAFSGTNYVYSDLGNGFKKMTCDVPLIFATDVVSFFCYIWTGIQTIKVVNCKLEKGVKATDWTPAPEDSPTNANIISTINLSPESIMIAANHVDIHGNTIDLSANTSVKIAIGQVSGNNLLTNTNFITDTSSWLLSNCTPTIGKITWDDLKGLTWGTLNVINWSKLVSQVNKITLTSTGTNGGIYQNFATIIGNVYTVQFMGKSSGTCIVGIEGKTTYNLTATRLKYSFTFTATATTHKFIAYANTGIVMSIDTIKVEIGSVLTSWSLSQLDTNMQLDYFSTTFSVQDGLISTKVSVDEVVSSINQSAEEISINASKISLEGLVTANSYFKILADGSMEAVNGKFGGTITVGGVNNISGIMTLLNASGTTAGIIDNAGINLTTGTYVVGVGVSQSRLWGAGLTLGNDGSWTQISSDSQVNWETNGHGIDIRGGFSCEGLSCGGAISCTGNMHTDGDISCNGNLTITGTMGGISTGQIIATGSIFATDSVIANGNIWADNNISALSFTDRTPLYIGDALSEIALISDDGNGGIDHSTLPKFAQKRIKSQKIKLDKDGKKIILEGKTIPKQEEIEEDGRDLGAMISILTVGMQQLTELVKNQATEIENLKLKI